MASGPLAVQPTRPSALRSMSLTKPFSASVTSFWLGLSLSDAAKLAFRLSFLPLFLEDLAEPVVRSGGRRLALFWRVRQVLSEQFFAVREVRVAENGELSGSEVRRHERAVEGHRVFHFVAGRFVILLAHVEQPE